MFTIIILWRRIYAFLIVLIIIKKRDICILYNFFTWFINRIFLYLNGFLFYKNGFYMCRIIILFFSLKILLYYLIRALLILNNIYTVSIIFVLNRCSIRCSICINCIIFFLYRFLIIFNIYYRSIIFLNIYFIFDLRQYCFLIFIICFTFII